MHISQDLSGIVWHYQIMLLYYHWYLEVKNNCTHRHQHKTLGRPSWTQIFLVMHFDFTQNFKHQNWAIPEHEKLRMWSLEITKNNQAQTGVELMTVQENLGSLLINQAMRKNWQLAITLAIQIPIYKNEYQRSGWQWKTCGFDLL